MPRLWTNTLGLLAVIDWHYVRVRQRTIQILSVHGVLDVLGIGIAGS